MSGNRWDNMREAYPEVAMDVWKNGSVVSPRGQETHEILDYSFTINNPLDAIPGRPNFSIPFAAVEAAQLSAGVSNPDLVLRINPTMERFMQWTQSRQLPVKYQHGAYGTRIGKYAATAVSRLKSDADTRQAILTIWNPELDYKATPDVPCTLSLHFMIRRDRLVLLTTMRSNDVWWGLPYDVFQFTQLQLTVAHALGIQAGEYHHRANSMHAYARDEDSLYTIHTDTPPLPYHPEGLNGSDDIKIAMYRGGQLMRAALDPDSWSFEPKTESERWYFHRLQYVSPRAT